MISDRLLSSENFNDPLRMFITGGAGTGKTFTLKIIVEQIRHLSNSSRAVTIAAPTGVAAKLIGGSTLHSTFALPIEKGKSPLLLPLTEKMSWWTSNLCPKCKILLNMHIIKELKQTMKYSTASQLDNIHALIELGFTPKMSKKVLEKLSPRVLETRSFLMSAKMLKELGFKNEQICAEPIVLKLLPSAIKHRMLLLEEAGFTKEKLILKWLRVKKNNKLVHTTVSELKMNGFIPKNINCMENIVSYTDLPKELYPSYTDDNLSFYDVQTMANQTYLSWKFNVNQSEIIKKYKAYSNLYMRSVRVMKENIETLNVHAGFSMEKILKNIYLLQFDPEVFLGVLQNVPMIGSTPIRDILDDHPKVIMRPASVIKDIVTVLEEYKIPLESLTRFASLLTLSPETVRERIEYLHKDPFYQPFFYHPRICKFIVQFSKVKKRTKHLAEIGWRCQSLELLSSPDTSYNSRVGLGYDKSNGSNTTYYLSKTLGMEFKEIRNRLSKNPIWFNARTSTVIENLKYLQGVGFENDLIVQALPVLLYPTEALKKSLEELESQPEVNCCRTADGNIRRDLQLQLVLYYLERPFNFTGNGIWDNPPAQESKISEEV